VANLLNFTKTEPPPLLLLLLLLLLVNGAAVSLPETVTVEGIMGHLNSLYQIATIGGRNSRSVRNNYNQSAEYVMEQLRPYCNPWTQHLVVPVHGEEERPTLSLVSPHQTVFQYGVDFAGMRYGGGGDFNITARVVEVMRGCTASDFAGFPAGSIALILEGAECELVQRAMLAEDFGAVAILFYNQQARTALLTTRVRFVEWKEGDRLVQKPCLSISNVMGKLLAEINPVVSLTANMLLTLDHTYNVLCESASGSKTDIVMLGAHLGILIYFISFGCCFFSIEAGGLTPTPPPILP